jgi:hypothetical protein
VFIGTTDGGPRPLMHDVSAFDAAMGDRWRAVREVFSTATRSIVLSHGSRHWREHPSRRKHHPEREMLIAEGTPPGH